MITPEMIDRNRRANIRLSELIRGQLRQLFNSLDLSNPEQVRDELLEVVPAVVEAYTPVGVQMGLEWYEEMAIAAGAAASFRAVTPDLPDFAEMAAKSVRYAAGHLFTGNPQKTLDVLDVKVDKFVKEPGRQTVIWNAEYEGDAWWARVPTGDETCSFCMVLASRGAAYQSERSAGSERYGEENLFHGQCVVPGTMVSGPNANVGYRRYYEGEIVTLVTAAGHNLSITPNHPVLTDRGWVPAGLLNEGDQLVSAVDAERNVVGGPNKNQMPSRIEDVVSALGMVSSATSRSVPGSPEQFHGDGFDSEVYVVSRNDLLGRVGDSSLLQPVSQLDLHRRSPGSTFRSEPLQSRNRLLAGLRGRMAPPSSLVGGGGLSESLGGGHLCSPHLAGVTGSSQLNSGFSEPASNYSPLGTQTIGYGVDTFAAQVGINNSVRSRDTSRKFNPPSFESTPDSRLAFVQLGSDLRDRLSRSVHLDRLIRKVVSEYSGHVFNLSTDEGWYSANSITVSNCDCEVIRLGQFEEYPEGYLPESIYDFYNESASRVGRNDLKKVLYDFRRRFPELVKDGVDDPEYLERMP